jgi:hypothetical protein
LTEDRRAEEGSLTPSKLTNKGPVPSSAPLVSRQRNENDRQAAPTKAPTGNSYHVTQEKKSKNSDDRHLQTQDFIVASIQPARVVDSTQAKTADRGLGCNRLFVDYGFAEPDNVSV